MPFENHGCETSLLCLLEGSDDGFDETDSSDKNENAARSEAERTLRINVVVVVVVVVSNTIAFPPLPRMCRAPSRLGASCRLFIPQSRRGGT